jgi:hypothetical protein
MRKVKFRGKRKEDGEWVYGYYVFTHDIHRIIYEDKEGYYCEDEVISETVGQFSGIEGVYEGDILGLGYIVSYVDGSKGEDLGMDIGFYEQRDNFESWTMLEAGREYKVVGNIHEK